MGRQPFFSIIVPTLLRDSLRALLNSIHTQTFTDYELLVRYDPEVNEYVSRNRAIQDALGTYLVFRDDDTVFAPDHLQIAYDGIMEFKKVHGFLPVAVGGPLGGAKGGKVPYVTDEPNWGIGANMIFLASMLKELGGFRENWGVEPFRCWRCDTDIWWKCKEKFSDKMLWMHNLVVDHPGRMGGYFVPSEEVVFIETWKGNVMKYFVPIDPRIQHFMLYTQKLTAEERAYVDKCRQELEKKMGKFKYNWVGGVVRG